MSYTQKQIDKFNRQKYIAQMEKVSKNIFRMLRDENVGSKDFVLKLSKLKKDLDERAEVQLDSEYHQQLKSYIVRLHRMTCLNETFCDKNLDDMREAEMSNLNRLQKLKNGMSYKKEKHRAKRQNDEWD